MNNSDAVAIIVAAGYSRRLSGIDKIFASLGGCPVIAWSLNAFESCLSVRQVVLVLNHSNLSSGQRLLASGRWSKVAGVSLGGPRRQDSVKAGLEMVKDHFTWAIIHDGARPFVTPELIETVLEGASETGAAIAAVPARDTVKMVRKNNTVWRTIPRERVWLAQTPQAFSYDIIRRAYETIDGEVTDDASLVERLGVRVKVCQGYYWNIKITTREDLMLARRIARALPKEMESRL